MRIFAIVIFALFCTQAVVSLAPLRSKQISVTVRPTSFYVEQPKAGLDLCPTCVNVMDQTINQLLNVILNVGVIGSCSALCNYVSNFGQLAVLACNLVCDGVGIKAFIELIKKADLDPIWLCQEVKFCPINDCTAATCAQFDRTVIQPQAGPKGTTFNIAAFFSVFNQTGTGEISFTVVPVGAMPMGFGELVPKGFAPGQYSIQAKCEIQDDPSQDPPVIFEPGVYKVIIDLCEGLCGSHHAHTRTLAVDHASFNVTASDF